MNAPDESPAADVYAGDLQFLSPADGAERVIHVFTIEADSEPGAFVRIANVLNIANVAPSLAIVESTKQVGILSIYIEIAAGLDTANSIRRKLLQLTEVNQVELRSLL